MHRRIVLSLVVALISLPVCAQSAPADWIAASNKYTNLLLAVEMKHTPELGSNQGLSQFDTEVSQPTLADEDQERQETEAVLATFKNALAHEKQKEVAQDLEIVIHTVELQFREQDFDRAHKVDFLNASETVFRGLRVLLDEQTPAERRPAAVVRIRKYAGLEPGYKPLAEILKQRVMEQMAKPGVVYPARTEIETELARNPNYVEGIATLLEKYKLTGWQEPLAQLKSQLIAYDEWTKANVLPKARSDFRLPPEEYALNLEDYGIDIPPAQLAAMAHQAFSELQAEMKPIAEQIAKERHLPSSDYRDVIRELKKQQLVGDAILPFYQERLKQIEKIIVDKQIVTLPDRPARIRLATAAETAQQPAPHMVPPPFLHNTGQKGEFVLPLNIPAGPGQTSAEKYDDFTFRCGGLDADRPRSPPRARVAVRFHARTWRFPGAGALRVQQHQCGRLGALFGIPHPALHAAGRTADFAGLQDVAGGAGVSRSRVAGREDPTRRGVPRSGAGRGAVARLCRGGSGALHLSLSRAGQQLLLRLYQADRLAEGRGSQARAQIQPEEVS